MNIHFIKEIQHLEKKLPSQMSDPPCHSHPMQPIKSEVPFFPIDPRKIQWKNCCKRYTKFAKPDICSYLGCVNKGTKKEMEYMMDE